MLDSPFFPALVAFGPFFLILFASLFFRRVEKPKAVLPAQVATASLVWLFVALAGLLGVYLLFLLSM